MTQQQAQRQEQGAGGLGVISAAWGPRCKWSPNVVPTGSRGSCVQSRRNMFTFYATAFK